MHKPGSPYRPSNVVDFERFRGSWCRRCRLYTPADVYGCARPSAAYWFELGHPNYPTEWQRSADGRAVCMAFSPTAEL